MYNTYIKNWISVMVLVILSSSYAFSQTTYNISLSSSKNQTLSKNGTAISQKSGTGTTIGDYVWFDYNQNGLQDIGEQGIYNVTINLRNNADCSGSILYTTKTSDIGYYEFSNLSKKSDKYCIEVIYPEDWTSTVANTSNNKLNSDLVSLSKSKGIIKNITVENNRNVDAGLHHSDENCQRIILNTGDQGTYDKSKTWAKRTTLDVKFKGLVASGFCHEYSNGGPKSGEKYTVHTIDRLGFTVEQRDYLSRIFAYMSDPEINTLIVDTFETADRHVLFNLVSATFVWYYSDWNRDFDKLENFIDTKSHLASLSGTEKSALKNISRIIIDKIEGTNGATQYPVIKIYYLWNETNDGHQDIIVPETSLVPDLGECEVEPIVVVPTEGACYAMTDNKKVVYQVYMSPNASPLPVAVGLDISERFIGEGSAYRASNNTLYAFQPEGDDVGPTDLYSINLDTGVSTKVINDLLSDSVDAAEFYRVSENSEILYIISKERSSRLYAFYADSWESVPSYPKDISGDGSNLSSIAIDPSTGYAYAVDDYNYDDEKPKVYKIDLATGKTTFIVQLKEVVDAEGLSFAADRNLYLEDEREFNGKKIYQVNLTTGALIPAGSLEGSSGDFESISCNGSELIVSNPKVDIEVSTNGSDADKPTGPNIGFDKEVKWTYVVKNTGNVVLKDVIVTDNKLNQVCTVTTLAVGASKTCSKTGKAVEGQYSNIGTVKAKSAQNIEVEDSDPSHYLGEKKAIPSINIEVNTNGVDADEPTGPSIAFGSSVKWTYIVTNIGNVDIYDVKVNDNKAGLICEIEVLVVGQSTTCEKTGTAQEGQYANIGKVIGTFESREISASDPSHYIGGNKPAPVVDIEVLTNGVDADKPMGPSIGFDDVVMWNYVVKNIGNVELKDLVVTDNKLNQVCTLTTLAVGASKTCSKIGKAIEGQYANIGTVKAKSPSNLEVVDTDPSHYIGGNKPVVAVNIEVNTNGIDADTPTGPNVKFDDSVTWNYVVKNIGNVELKDVLVTDNKLNEICKVITLSVDASKTCSKTGKAIEGQYANVGTVKAKSEQNVAVSDTDPSHYIGGDKPEEPNNPPVTNDDTKVGERCKAISLNILDNDSDIDKDLNVSTVNLLLISGWDGTDTDNDGDIDTVIVPDEGRWSVSNDGLLTYTPSNDCSVNPTRLRYTVMDKVENLSNKAIVTVTYPDAEKSSLGNFVWFDADKNGKQDSGEGGLKGIVVELFDANDELNGTTSTDENGSYAFVNLDTGEYTLKFTLKEGYSFSPKDADDVNETLNSDADTQTGKADSIILTEGETNNDVDVGMFITPKPSIDIVKTTNGGNVNNIMVGDVITWTYVIKNTGNTRVNNIVVSDDKEGVVTECDGDDSLNPGQSMTCTKVGTAILGTYSNIGEVEGIDTNTNKVSDTDSSSYVGKDAPVLLGTVGDYVWLDSNKNGIQDTEELPLQDISVQLFDKNKKLIASTKTDATGKYLFKEVLAGEYTIKFVVPNGYTVTLKEVGSDRTQDSNANSNGKTSSFILSEGANDLSIDLGLYPTLTNLGDKVFLDANANGIQDDDEQQGVANVNVKLYREDNTLIDETKTTSTGQYLFRNLVPANYYVVFDVPNNFKVSPQNQGGNESDDSDADVSGKTDTVTLIGGQDNKAVDMGLYQEAIKLGDRVFYDTNKNGIQDQGETGVGEVEVKLYRVSNNDLVATTKTSASGIYLFDAVVAGEYYIVFTKPVGYSITKRAQGSEETDSNPDSSGRTAIFTLVAGTQDSSIDMGVYQDVVSYGDRVFLDTNHNGLQDLGEKGVRDVNVTIYSANSDFSKSMLSDENGNYLFTHLPAGEYSAEFRDIPYGHLITERDVNNNESDLNDSDGFLEDEKIITEVALLTPGKNDLSWDLGIYKTVCLPGKSVLGNLVFEDFNKDGIQDIGERGVAAVKVTLFNNDTDEEVGTTVTDENGLYEFAHVDPEFNYYVQFTVPAGFVVSPQDQDNDTIDSDADETGKTDVIVLEADQINSTVDMGIYREGSAIGDRVFFDEFNGVSNGIQDAGEVGANDIKVTLYTADGAELNSTRTNVSGEYHFTNIPAGRYTIGFSELPTGYVFALAKQGNDDEKDSDVNTNGKTNTIVVNGKVNITSIDAGLKKVNTGISANDIKSGITGQNVTLDVLLNDTEGTFNFDVSTVRLTSVPDGATLSEDGRTLSVPNEGVWRVDPDTGAITFTPADGFVGDPTAIAYTVQDTEGNETGADVEVNYPPLAVDDNVNAQTGTQVIIYVLENDSNTSSPLDVTSLRLIDPISGDEVETVNVLGQGTWSINIDGSVTFTPDADFVNNPTPIEYVVREIAGDVSNRAIITIVYPDAVDDTVIVPVDTIDEITVNVPENDSNNTVATTVTIGCEQPSVDTLVVNDEGTWSVSNSGAIVFTPESGFIAEPTDIQYTIGLVSGERSNCATVDIRRELLAVDDSSTLNVGSVTLINILRNDLGSLNAQSVRLVLPVPHVAGSTLSDDGKVLTVPSEGVWSVNDLGIVSFTAEEAFTTAPTAIKYTVENNTGLLSNVANITLIEGGVSVVANDDTGTADAGNPVIVDVLNNDTGDLNRSSVRIITADGEEVTTYVVSGEGTWTVGENGDITFTGEGDFVGTPTAIRYIVSDNSVIVLSDTATVTIDGTCDCRPYETSIPAMGKLAGLVTLILTLLISILFFREEKLLVKKCYN